MKINQDSNYNNHEWHDLLSPFPVFPNGIGVNDNILIAIEEYYKSNDNPLDTWVATIYFIGDFVNPFEDSEYGHEGYFNINYFGSNIEFCVSDCTKFDIIDGESEEYMYRIIGWKYIEPFAYAGMNEYRKALEGEANE